MFEKLFGRRSKIPPDPFPERDPFSEVRWLEPAENSFGIRVLDCRSVATGLRSITSDAEVAVKFLEHRVSEGFEHVDKVTTNSIHAECNLRYSSTGRKIADGCLFRAAVMEEKWNIYLHHGYLYFARSWTGALISRARIEFLGMGVIIDQVEANQDTATSPEFAVQLVDFLIKSHLYNLEVPHPIPLGIAPTIRDVAMYSFSIYGCRGLFASYEDTTKARNC